MVQEVLDSERILEVSLSDYEWPSPPSSPPASSISMLGTGSEGSDPIPSILNDYPRCYNSPDSGSSSLNDCTGSIWVKEF
jgi:hypothetical protein